MMLIVLLLIVAPIIEIYVAIQVAHVIGGWETIALMFLMGVLGAWLLKQQGLAVLARISTAVAEGRAPAAELIDGLLIVVAGALMAPMMRRAMRRDLAKLKSILEGRQSRS